MKAVIDTTSLVSFVRYYLPFDKQDKLKLLLSEKFEHGELIVLDKVFDESRFVAKGIVIKELDFLNKTSKHVKTNLILPQPKFFNILDNQLCYGAQKNKLSITQFEIERNRFLETADAKLVLYCNNNSSPTDKPILVTEESRTDNDSKLFKKLPEICNVLNIDHCSLPVLLKEHFKIKLSDYLI